MTRAAPSADLAPVVEREEAPAAPIEHSAADQAPTAPRKPGRPRLALTDAEREARKREQNRERKRRQRALEATGDLLVHVPAEIADHYDDLAASVLFLLKRDLARRRLA